MSGSVISVWCHSWVLWQSPDTPSCLYSYERMCSSVLETCTLSCLRPCFALERGVRIPGTHVLVSVSCWGSDTSRSIFCLVVWVCWCLDFARPHTLSTVLCLCFCTQLVVFIALRAFMLSCLVWTCGLWLFSLAEYLCLFCTWLVIGFAGHVLVFSFVHWAQGFCLSSLCAMCSHVNCLDPTHLVTWYWLICPPVFPRYTSSFAPFIISLCLQFCASLSSFHCRIFSVLALPCLVSCPVFPLRGSFCLIILFSLNKAHLLHNWVPRLIPSSLTLTKSHDSSYLRIGLLVKLSDRSSAPTLLGCRPSARKLRQWYHQTTFKIPYTIGYYLLGLFTLRLTPGYRHSKHRF